jgi:hypothetical protein
LPVGDSYTFIPKQGFKSHNHPSKCDHKTFETGKRTCELSSYLQPARNQAQWNGIGKQALRN